MDEGQNLPKKRVKTNWTAIKREAMEGVDNQSLGKKYGIAVRAIALKAEQEQWPTPSRLSSYAKEIQAMRSSLGDHFSGFGEGLEDADFKGLTTQLASNFEGENGSKDQYQRFIFRLCAMGIAHFGIAAPIPKTWKDVEILDKMARRAAGLDEKGQIPGGNPVNVNILSMAGSPVVAVESKSV